jgi:quinol monooxygenase YgiN
MDTTIRMNDKIATLINIFTVAPENRQRLIDLLRDGTETLISKLPGWISTNFLSSADGSRVLVYSQWRDAKDIDAMRQNPEMGRYLQRVAPLATFEAMLCEVNWVHHA